LHEEAGEMGDYSEEVEKLFQDMDTFLEEME